MADGRKARRPAGGKPAAPLLPALSEFGARWAAFKELSGRRPKQVWNEAATCYAVIKALQPTVFVEIGSARGGTLYVYAGACAPGARLVAVDAGWEVRALDKTVERLGAEGFDVHQVRGSSHEAATLKKVRSLGAGCGLLHIDGDHSAKGALQDFEHYAPLVGKGGLIAMHDIAFRQGTCKVYHAWQTIKAEARIWSEIIGPVWGGKTNVGIGLVWKHK